MKRWEDRLAEMDHSRGTSDKMRKDAMLAEIKDLRAAVADPQGTIGSMRAAHTAEIAALRKSLADERRKAKDAQANAAAWRSRFADLRKLLLKVKVE